MFEQKKAVAAGKINAWALDVEAMNSCASWSKRNPGLLNDELDQILKSFPTFIAVLGRTLGEERCYVEAAEPVLCPNCQELVVFNQGIRCVSCGTPVHPPLNSVVGLIGRIPALITDRPFEASLNKRLSQLTLNQDAQHNIWTQACLSVNQNNFLAPRFGLWFGETWPHTDPPVMVWPEYFSMLDISPDHVYEATPFYRLCLYASWREQPAVHVLQNRVVPRLLIDLMVADLQAVDQLDKALNRMDSSLYELYNLVGHSQKVKPFEQVYKELTNIEPTNIEPTNA